MKDKAYKLLALQENISNREAKNYIDSGYVYCANQKVSVARAEMDEKSRFKINKPENFRIIFQNEDLIVIDKPWGVESYSLEKKVGGKLIHRLDKSTSGVMAFAKNEEYRLKVIEEFKQERVFKEYIAIVSGVVAEEIEIDLPIVTIKDKVAKSKIDLKIGKSAYTKAYPVENIGKKTKLIVEIKTGRTHQIRVHLSHNGLPIFGDDLYGGKKHSRLMLHSHKLGFLGKEFVSPEPLEFKEFIT